MKRKNDMPRQWVQALKWIFLDKYGLRISWVLIFTTISVLLFVIGGSLFLFTIAPHETETETYERVYVECMTTERFTQEQCSDIALYALK